MASLQLRPAPVRRVPPRFSIPPADSEIMPGGNVNITCVAVGSPMPYVKWMLGAEDLTPEDDMPIGRNVLELTDVRQSNNYTCVAMSTLGVIEAVAQIIVKGECHTEVSKAGDEEFFKRWTHLRPFFRSFFFLTLDFTGEALHDWSSKMKKVHLAVCLKSPPKKNLGLVFP